MRPSRKAASKARAPVRKPSAKPKPARKPAPGPRSEPPDYSIAAVERALDLLDALARTGPATLVALAAQAKCTRSNAFRLLRTLQSRGFAIQDEARGVWRLGARWAMLGRASHDQGAMAATAASFLATLGQAVGENTYLRTRDNLAAETVAVYQAEPGLRLYSEPGTRAPLHAGPSRLLLAYAPEAVQTQVLTQRLPRFTPATRTDPNWIAADLQRIRSRGFLITADEVHPGAVSITAPIWDAGGHVVAALTVSGPSMRMRPPRPRSLLPQLLETARRLSAALGGSAPERVPETHASAQSKASPRSHANPPAPAALR
ncbi:MAG: IclR family transcriptional regulator [Acetobacteraceae bacterium]|nr:IclR family transcriptional regulator [Acetobacteraceae bacterium]